MDGSDPAKTNFERYEQVLNIVFGAAFGVLGSLSMPDELPPQGVLLVALQLVLSAGFSIWCVVSCALIARCMADLKRVKKTVLLITIAGLTVSSGLILGLAEAATSAGAEVKGIELVTVLWAWSVCYLLMGVGVGIQRKIS